MKPEIENLKVWMSGRDITGYQKALGVREFKLLLDYVKKLEDLRQPSVNDEVCPDCLMGRDEFEPDWKCPDCRQRTFRSYAQLGNLEHKIINLK